MSNKGYIRLHRQIQDCWIWEDKFSRGQAWVDLLLYANHRDKKVPMRNEIITVKRGQFLTSIRKLAERWGWHRNTVSNFLKLLEKDNMVCIEVSTQYTLITIVNYDIYQYSENEDVPLNVPQGVPESVPPTVPRSSTTNKYINENNDNKDINIPPLYPPIGEKEKGKKTSAKEMAISFKKMIDDTELSDGLKTKLHEWIDYKVEIKHPYKTERGMNQFINQVANYTLEYSDTEIIEVINKTMASEYQGIVWDWLKKDERKNNSQYMDAIKNRVSVVDDWV